MSHREGAISSLLPSGGNRRRSYSMGSQGLTRPNMLEKVLIPSETLPAVPGSAKKDFADEDLISKVVQERKAQEESLTMKRLESFKMSKFIDDGEDLETLERTNRVPVTYSEEQIKYIRSQVLSKLNGEENHLDEKIKLSIKPDRRFSKEVNEFMKRELYKRVHDLMYQIYVRMEKHQRKLNLLGVFDEASNHVRIRSLFKVEVQQLVDSVEQIHREIVIEVEGKHGMESEAAGLTERRRARKSNVYLEQLRGHRSEQLEPRRRSKSTLVAPTFNVEEPNSFSRADPARQERNGSAGFTDRPASASVRLQPLGTTPVGVEPTQRRNPLSRTQSAFVSSHLHPITVQDTQAAAKPLLPPPLAPISPTVGAAVNPLKSPKSPKSPKANHKEAASQLTTQMPTQADSQPHSQSTRIPPTITVADAEPVTETRGVVSQREQSEQKAEETRTTREPDTLAVSEHMEAQADIPAAVTTEIEAQAELPLADTQSPTENVPETLAPSQTASTITVLQSEVLLQAETSQPAPAEEQQAAASVEAETQAETSAHPTILISTLTTAPLEPNTAEAVQPTTAHHVPVAAVEIPDAMESVAVSYASEANSSTSVSEVITSLSEVASKTETEEEAVKTIEHE